MGIIYLEVIFLFTLTFKLSGQKNYLFRQLRNEYLNLITRPLRLIPLTTVSCRLIGFRNVKFYERA